MVISVFLFRKPAKAYKVGQKNKTDPPKQASSHETDPIHMKLSYFNHKE